MYKHRTACAALCLCALALLLPFAAAFAEFPAPRETVLESVPDFGGLNGRQAVIRYGERDALGRCTAATAVLGPELRQGEERADIADFRPTGLHNAAYGFIRDRWVYNRCHLIGRQLGGADELNNLFTGTHALNHSLMLPRENEIAAYIRKTGNHVFYRVTPLYDGDNLLCSAVLLEAESAEDAGAGLRFCVLLPNSEPGVAIDYATGYTTRADDWESGGTAAGSHAYVVNTRTGKFHAADCPDAGNISRRNRRERTGLRSDLIREGLTPCGKCRP